MVNHTAEWLPEMFWRATDARWAPWCLLLATAGTEPDWEGSALLTGLPAANYIAFSVYGPDKAAVYLGINPHSSYVQADLPAPPVRPAVTGPRVGRRQSS